MTNVIEFLKSPEYKSEVFTNALNILRNCAKTRDIMVISDGEMKVNIVPDNGILTEFCHVFASKGEEVVYTLLCVNSFHAAILQGFIQFPLHKFYKLYVGVKGSEC